MSDHCAPYNIMPAHFERSPEVRLDLGNSNLSLVIFQDSTGAETSRRRSIGQLPGRALLVPRINRLSTGGQPVGVLLHQFAYNFVCSRRVVNKEKVRRARAKSRAKGRMKRQVLLPLTGCTVYVGGSNKKASGFGCYVSLPFVQWLTEIIVCQKFLKNRRSKIV